jgi:predicted nuclease of predicted toxin-antitoxin system
MTYWLDAHLQPELSAWLGSRFNITVKSLREVGLDEADDDVIAAAARRFGNITILTKDVLFVETVRKAGSPPKMVLLKCGNLTALETQMWLSRVFEEVLAKLNAGDDIVEVAGPGT